jgi:hypothetical protein
MAIMNISSPVTTAALTLTATQIQPLVEWGLTGFHQPVPANVPGVISALIVMVVHAVGNIIAAKLAKTS